MNISDMARRIFKIGGIFLLLYFVLGFSRRMAEYTRLNAQLENEGVRITQLAATEYYLREQIAYATSEAAVEEWARENARMAESGDFPVIPLPPPGVTPQAEAGTQTEIENLSNWQTWLQWFFNHRP
jgi:cell division protein FtsB